MKLVTVAFTCLWFVSATAAFGQDATRESASRLETQGRFRESAVLLRNALGQPGLEPGRRKELEFELDRLDRIRKDFPYSKEALFAALKKSVKGVTESEFHSWLKEGRFENRVIDGERLFMASSVPNLFFRNPELYSRRIPPKSSASVEQHHWEVCMAIRKAALEQHRPYVLPKRFSVEMTVTADANAAPGGQVVRAWLPVPREYPFQGSIHITSAHPAIQQLADEQSSIRSAYFEQPAREGKPTEFELGYEYTAQGVWFDVKPGEVKPCNLDEPGLRPYTMEAPHIVFTSRLRDLSQKLAGDETNPYLKAKRFYEWIAKNIRYSFALEYSTIRNISETCLQNGYGDCGQEALLFMTLCRLNGIPARWQSGWSTFPGGKSIHDWCEIYIAPYGWMPVDPYMGIYATQYATTLGPEKQRELRDFYFGGLDQYRIIANRGHAQTLVPAKQSMRSDNVDFQRGELEWGTHNIYFDKFSYELTSKEIPMQP